MSVFLSFTSLCPWKWNKLFHLECRNTEGIRNEKHFAIDITYCHGSRPQDNGGSGVMAVGIMGSMTSTIRSNHKFFISLLKNTIGNKWYGYPEPSS